MNLSSITKSSDVSPVVRTLMRESQTNKRISALEKLS